MGQAQRILRCAQASKFRERNTIYRYNGSVHRWIVVRQGFSLPIKLQKLRARFKYWKNIQANIFSAVSFTVATMNKPVIAQVCCHRFFVNTLNSNLLLNLQHFGSCASWTFSGILHHLSTNLCRRYLYFPF